MSISALCVGHASYDLCMVVDSFPAENSKTETEFLIESGGGPAANAAWLLARWGVPTAMAGLVGTDDYGQCVLSELRQAGVDCRLMQQLADHPTPVSFVVVNRCIASRTIINRKHARAALNLDAATLTALAPKLLLFDGHELKASLAALKAFPSAVTILDAGSLREGTKALAEHVQYLVCSERFAVEVTGRTDVSASWECSLPRLQRARGQVVVVTLGEQGSMYYDGKQWGQVPALSGPACDTTGAGDIFHGAFAFALLREMALHAALEFATAAAGLSVRKFGGRTSAPELAEVWSSMSHGT